MIALAHQLAAGLAAAPTPSPSPAEQLDTTTVTPGIEGFIATFLLALAAIGLFLLMARSLRRTSHNAQARGMDVAESARGVRTTRLPVRAPEPTVPGVLDGGSPVASPETGDPGDAGDAGEPRA
ncbi:hypothetical protein [Xylanimonas allomyrinae]|uniref:hypothetical protein n=1 Tax=Xylanimonas allomyrinae TaxID=2509459 RepID=UPI001FE246C5|nr:hypothetical protein [Xylanimonas allomyrinae]